MRQGQAARNRKPAGDQGHGDRPSSDGRCCEGGGAAGKAPGREARDHYVVEVELGAGGWLQRRDRFELASEAQLQAEGFRRAGGAARVVRVAADGTREVVG
jgi:hypothetical protein